MRRPVADPHAMLAAIAARVDATERDLAALRGDVNSLGRGVADILAQLRRLTANTPNPNPSPPAPADGDPEDGDGQNRDAENGADGADDADGEEGQRDWLAVTDPATARAWLAEAVEWAVHVSAWYGLDLPGVPCWPLHPAVVGDLLALAAQREHAHAQTDPTAVMEWLTRWLPAGLNRIRTELGPCRRDTAHHHAGRLVDATGLTTPDGLTDAATWWTTARHLPAPDWLDLPHLH